MASDDCRIGQRETTGGRELRSVDRVLVCEFRDDVRQLAGVDAVLRLAGELPQDLERDGGGHGVYVSRVGRMTRYGYN